MPGLNKVSYRETADESDWMDDFCANLVTQEPNEPFVLRLLTDRAAGEWVRVDELCRTVGVSTAAENTEILATWLTEPTGDRRYCLILFWSTETYRSFTAIYNRERLDNFKQADTA
jgi:hypothetical protein